MNQSLALRSGLPHCVKESRADCQKRIRAPDPLLRQASPALGTAAIIGYDRRTTKSAAAARNDIPFDPRTDETQHGSHGPHARTHPGTALPTVRSPARGRPPAHHRAPRLASDPARGPTPRNRSLRGCQRPRSLHVALDQREPDPRSRRGPLTAPDRRRSIRPARVNVTQFESLTTHLRIGRGTRGESSRSADFQLPTRRCPI